MAIAETSRLMPERVQVLDDEALDQLARAVAKAMGAQSQSHAGTNWDRILTYVIGTLTIVSLIFTFGVNWSRISSNERRLDIIEKRIEASDGAMVNIRDKVSASSEAIQAQLGDIKSQLGEIRGTLSSRAK